MSWSQQEIKVKVCFTDNYATCRVHTERTQTRNEWRGGGEGGARRQRRTAFQPSKFWIEVMSLRQFSVCPFLRARAQLSFHRFSHTSPGLCWIKVYLQRVYIERTARTDTEMKQTWMCLFFLKGVEWGLHFPSANGEYQSPINLNSREAQYDPSLLDVGLSPNYVVCRDCEVINDGHTVRILLKSKSGDSQETWHDVSTHNLLTSWVQRQQVAFLVF